ncbi:MAG: TIGR02453 family protein [Gemmatimonadales bacterium]
MSWSVYILRCADDTLYTGVARDLTRRLAEHNAGRGAKYTRTRRPVVVAWSEPAHDRSVAQKREWELKQLPRAAKLRLLRTKAPAADEFRGLPGAAFTFLRQLRRHNRRDWFEEHRETYDAALRAPLQALADAMDVRLAGFAPELVGDPKRSLFRIHRDVRFSRDKSPYKTHAALWFYHRDAGRGVGHDAHGGAGFYLHVEPGECRAGGGIWMPPRPSLQRIREALTEDTAAFAGILRAPAFRRTFGPLNDEGILQRLPRGFAADDPAGPWLRYPSFFSSTAIPDAAFARADLPALLERRYRTMLPLVRWLNAAIGFPAAERR